MWRRRRYCLRVGGRDHSGDCKNAANGDLPELIAHVIPPRNSALTSCNNTRTQAAAIRQRHFNSAKKLAIPGLMSIV
jgi:hypothetical protein